MQAEGGDERFLRPTRGVQRHGAPTPRRPYRLLAVLVGTLTALFLGQRGREYLLTTPHLAVNEVVFVGTSRLEPAFVESVRTELRGKNLLALDFADLDQWLRETQPWIRETTIHRGLPHRITVRVEEHVAIARGQDGHSLLTSTGELRSAKPALASDPDLISVVGDLTTEATRTRLIELVGLLGRGSAPLVRRVVHISVIQPDDFVVQLTDVSYTLHLGDGEFRERLNRFHNVEPLLANRYQSLERVDLRFRDRVIVSPVSTSPPTGRG